MTNETALKAQSRDHLGKAHTRRLRRLAGRVPAVIYGDDQAPQHVSLAGNEVVKAFENPAFQSQLLTLQVDDQPQQVVLRDKQLHPAKGVVMHIDFLRVSAKKAIHMTVPLHFEGEDVAPGVKAGGLLERQMVEVNITCLPADLPASITVDVSTLELDSAVHLSELALPKGVTLTAEVDAAHDHSVVSIHMPRVAAEVEEEESATAPTSEETPTESKE